MTVFAGSVFLHLERLDEALLVMFIKLKDADGHKWNHRGDLQR